MHVYTLQREQLIPASPAETFDFFADALNLEAITPPWLGFEVVTPRPIAMGAGALIEYRLKLHALPLRWLTRIEAWEPGRRFADRQLRGPYRLIGAFGDRPLPPQRFGCGGSALRSAD